MRLKVVGEDPNERAQVIQAWPSRKRLGVVKELAAALDFLHSGAAQGHKRVFPLSPSNSECFWRSDRYQEKRIHPSRDLEER